MQPRFFPGWHTARILTASVSVRAFLVLCIQGPVSNSLTGEVLLHAGSFRRCLSEDERRLAVLEQSGGCSEPHSVLNLGCFLSPFILAHRR